MTAERERQLAAAMEMWHAAVAATIERYGTPFTSLMVELELERLYPGKVRFEWHGPVLFPGGPPGSWYVAEDTGELVVRSFRPRP